MNYYTIKDLEIISGIKAHTIRIWEKRYGFLVPERTSTNIRFYTDEELKLLLNVAALVKRGHKISKVAAYGEQRIHEEVLKLSEQSSSMDDYLDQLVIHIINFDHLKFERVLDSVQEKLGFEKMMTELVFPLFRKIGIYWQIGSLFPAQEHLISNLIRQRIIVEAARCSVSDQAPTALFFLPENEWHELGLLYSRYLAAKAGVNVIYLGQNVPLDDLQALSDQIANRLAVVVTSFVSAIEKEKLEDELQKIGGIFPNIPVVVSGMQVRISEPQLPANVRFVQHYDEFHDWLLKKALPGTFD
ncbi:MerR family transcriptional regulator [Mangrovibacterium marinum]|uniref:DNA-binding transcriptional MerR regulator n=1 Tax=Mangrovibacterium marinum TaxID=1639118 RepID=A0A2T5BYC0_9BACT|nr:MerR family transcriptional regulator [Mangrovibacterium marinum]PTN06772.1 DNA-binding transcriptional MerR regulator [Mangrovibacterium marinum]